MFVPRTEFVGKSLSWSTLYLRLCFRPIYRTIYNELFPGIRKGWHVSSRRARFVLSRANCKACPCIRPIAAGHLHYIQYTIEFSAGRPDQNNMTLLRGRCILSGRWLLRHLLRLPKLWQRSAWHFTCSTPRIAEFHACTVETPAAEPRTCAAALPL